VRILYSHYLPSDDHPAVRMVQASAAELVRLGHEVRIHRTQPAAVPVSGASRAPTPSSGRVRRALWFTKELARNRAGLRRDSAALADFRPDVVFCRQDAYRFSMPLACRRAGAPVVTFADAPVAYETRQFNQEGRWHPPGLVERIERWNLRQSRAVVAVSHPTARLIEGYRTRVPVTVVGNGVDTDRFRPRSEAERAETRRRLGIHTPHVVGFVGTFRRFHGLPLLRELMARTLNRQDLTWVLIGDGPERGELASLEGHPRARFLGRQPAEEVPDLLATLDVMVVPHQRLISEFYFCPIKVLEGMAAGVACLASDQGDIPIILDRGRAGQLVATDDPGDWAVALAELLNYPTLRLGLQHAARNRVLAEYTWGHTAQRLEDVLIQASEPAIVRPLVTAV